MKILIQNFNPILLGFFRGGEHHSMNRDRGGGGRGGGGGGGGGGWGRDGQMDLKVLFV